MNASAPELWQLDAVELATLIRQGHVSAREATESVLARCDAVNPAINAVVRRLDDEARAAADAADAARARGEPLGLLHGVPVTTKCNTDQRGLPTDNGVVAYRDLIAQEDAPVVANLRRAGAVIVGRTNTPAFSMRGHTDNDLHGPTFNPWNRRITPGGSSGGAGAAVSAGIGPIAHGNDIGGSIRWPAFCNGVAGLRPSYGRVPRLNFSGPTGRPMSAQLMSVDGPLARSVRDLRIGFAAMAAGDHRDNRWVPVPLQLEPPARPIRVALVTRSDGPAVHPGTWAAVREAGRRLQAAGYAVEEANPPEMNAVNALWSAIGITEQATLLWPLVEKHGDEGARRFMSWWIAARPPRDLTGYMTAFVERDTLRLQWNRFFAQYPIVVMPSAPGLPFEAGADVRDRDAASAMLDNFYYQFQLPPLGIPGLCLPVGTLEGLPMGVQLTAARYREDLLLDAGEVIESYEPVRRPIDAAT